MCFVPRLYAAVAMLTYKFAKDLHKCLQHWISVPVWKHHRVCDDYPQRPCQEPRAVLCPVVGSSLFKCVGPDLRQDTTLTTLRMTATKLWTHKKNMDPHARIRSRDELRPQVAHQVSHEQKEELEAPQQYFVELKKLKKAPPAEKIITKTFGGVEMKGILVSTGPEGWWKVKNSETKAVTSTKTETSEDFDLRENQHVLHHVELAKSELGSYSDIVNTDSCFSLAAMLDELDDEQGMVSNMIRFLQSDLLFIQIYLFT